MNRRLETSWRGVSLSSLLIFVAALMWMPAFTQAQQAEPAPAKPGAKPTARKTAKLPGLLINFQGRYVDLEATG